MTTAPKFYSERKDAFPQEDLVFGEVAECRLMVKEVSKQPLIGELFLSNFKLLFRPNSFKKSECLRFILPYGYISKVTESSNDAKTQCSITLTSKDERILKFKFENNPGQFRETLGIIGKYALLRNVNDLYCCKSVPGKMNHEHIAKEVLEDFDRLGITQRFQ